MAHPTAGNAILRQVGLGCINKTAEQAREEASKQQSLVVSASSFYIEFLP